MLVGERPFTGETPPSQRSAHSERALFDLTDSGWMSLQALSRVIRSASRRTLWSVGNRCDLLAALATDTVSRTLGTVALGAGEASAAQLWTAVTVGTIVVGAVAAPLQQIASAKTLASERTAILRCDGILR